ncbi:MAG TPA: tetratricopeptide repeat protein [Thermoanaerobaculia bacterium]|nr:tetratricopeptide repeat protein [Thermoanaerobaculia bacterium]
MRRALAAALLLGLPAISPAQTRLASDFEIAQMREQIANSSGFVAQLSGRLNLGDLYLSRGEISTARAEYGEALALALADRVEARRASDMTRYATSTAYAGLAQAKLGRGPEAFELLEEATRFTSDSPKSWNLYATAMSILGRPGKGASAAHNAVTIATAELQRAPSVAGRLDLAVYQYTLAAALTESGGAAGAEPLLRLIVESLSGPPFEGVRRQIERSESFEIYSTARGEAAAYLSLLNRAQLRLAAVLEKRGDTAGARKVYQRVLEQRSDDVTALSGLARLTTAEEQRRYFAAAFDANPFSLSLVRAYQDHLAAGSSDAADTSTTGGKVRLALMQIHRGELRAARASLDDLDRRFPGNTTLHLLRGEMNHPTPAPAFLSRRPAGRVEPSIEDLRHLVALAAAERLTPEHRAALDAITFASSVVFTAATASGPGQTILASGTVGAVSFRFAEPTAFVGSFAAATPLRLTYRILGVTEIGGADALLLEPLGLEVPR